MADEDFGIVISIDGSKAIRDGVNPLDQGLKRVEESARAVEKAAASAAGELERSARQAAQAQEKAARESSAGVRAAMRAQEEYAKGITVDAERRAKARAQTEEAAAKRAAAAQKAVVDQYKDAQAKLAQSYRSIVGPAAEYNRNLSRAVQLERQGAITAQQRATYVRSLQREMTQFSAQQKGGIGGAISSFGSSQLGAIAAPAAVVAGTVATVRSVLDMSDAYQTLTNRLRAVTSSEAEAIEVRGKLLAVANATRVSTEATAEVYARLAAIGGRSQDELVDFTSSLNKAVKLSGATATEASAGMIQLAQGLGAGALRGDELRSVLEQLPFVADVIAKSMGVTRGQLRSLGEDGKITADEVFKAFAKSKESIDERFGKSVATVSDLMTVMRNTMTDAVGSIVEATGVVPVLAKAFEAMGGVVAEVATRIKQVITITKDLDDVTGGLAGKWIKGGLKNTGAILEASTATSKAVLDAIETKLSNRNIGDVYAEASDKIADAKRKVAYEDIMAANNAKFFLQDKALQAKVLEQLTDVYIAMEDSLYDAETARKSEEKAAKEAAAQYRQILSAYQGISSAASTAYKATLELANAEEMLTKAVRVGLTTREHAAELLASLRDKLKDQLDPYAAELRAIKENTAAIGVDEETRKRHAESMKIEADLLAKGVKLTADQRVQLQLALVAQEAAVAKAKELADAEREAQAIIEDGLNRQRQIYQSLYGPAQEYSANLAALNAEYERGAISLDQYNTIAEKMRASAGGGSTLTDLFNDEATAKVINFADALTEKLGSALDKTIDALLELNATGKASFADLARSVLLDLEKMIAKMLIMQGVKALVGLGGGYASFGSALASGLGINLGGNASGGSYVVPNTGGGVDSVPIYARVTPGERVTITPPGREAASGGGGAGPVNIKAVFVADMQAAAIEALNTPAGQRVVTQIVAANARAAGQARR